MKNIFYFSGYKLMIKKILLIIFLILMQKFVIAETIYVSNEKDHNISVIDGNSLEVIKTVKVGHRPRGIILSKDKKKIIICTSDDNRITVVDVASLEVEYYLPSGPDPELMVMDEDGKFIYVANEDDNMVTVVDYHGKKIVKEISKWAKPNAIIASSSSGLLPTKIQQSCKLPERFLIAHPFNPVYLLPLVELVKGKKTKIVLLSKSSLIPRTFCSPFSNTTFKNFLISNCQESAFIAFT